ncbi:MAG: hypothetical protein LUI05_03245 [Oscillospiraceae bacterium]|nr:hypothetical protein [Oscillospiraceae bacterium]
MAAKSEKNISHKTDAVMKLLTGGNLAVNPMLDNEFKQSVIEMHTSDSFADDARSGERDSERKEKKTGSATEICISSELITEILPVALKRFHCCTCEKCFAEAMADALESIPAISVKIRNGADMKKAENMRKSSRSGVMREIVKIVIARRGLPRHQ